MERALSGDNLELGGLDGGCAPQLRTAQYARFRIDAPHRTEVPSEAFTQCLKDLWGRFRNCRGVREDARNAVLHQQALLGVPALGYIDHGSHILDQRTSLVHNRVPNRMQVPDRSIGHQVPVIQYQLGFVAQCVPDGFIGTVAIFRVYEPSHLVIVWQATARIPFVDTEHFVGPVDHFRRARVEGPTACICQPLRFSEIRLALPPSLLSTLALRQVEHEGNTLVFTFEARSTDQYGHVAAVLADVVPFKRLQAPGALDLCGKLLTIEAEPLGS